MGKWYCEKCRCKSTRNGLVELLGYGSFVCESCIDKFLCKDQEDIGGVYCVQFDDDEILDACLIKDIDYNGNQLIRLSINKRAHIGDYIFNRKTAMELAERLLCLSKLK